MTWAGAGSSGGLTAAPPEGTLAGPSLSSRATIVRSSCWPLSTRPGASGSDGGSSDGDWSSSWLGPCGGVSGPWSAVGGGPVGGPCCVAAGGVSVGSCGALCCAGVGAARWAGRVARRRVAFRSGAVAGFAVRGWAAARWAGRVARRRVAFRSGAAARFAVRPPGAVGGPRTRGLGGSTRQEVTATRIPLEDAEGRQAAVLPRPRMGGWVWPGQRRLKWNWAAETAACRVQRGPGPPRLSLARTSAERLRKTRGKRRKSPLRGEALASAARCLALKRQAPQDPWASSIDVRIQRAPVSRTYAAD